MGVERIEEYRQKDGADVFPTSIYRGYWLTPKSYWLVTAKSEPDSTLRLEYK